MKKALIIIAIISGAICFASASCGMYLCTENIAGSALAYAKRRLDSCCE